MTTEGNRIKLSSKWTESLVKQPETGMGYQVCTIHLKDGREFKQTVIFGGKVAQIKGIEIAPFSEDEIEAISVTHDKSRL